jgi:hypothetical protein
VQPIVIHMTPDDEQSGAPALSAFDDRLVLAL